MFAIKSLRKMFRSKFKIILPFCSFYIIVQKNNSVVKNFKKKTTRSLVHLEKYKDLQYNSNKILHKSGVFDER